MSDSILGVEVLREPSPQCNRLLQDRTLHLLLYLSSYCTSLVKRRLEETKSFHLSKEAEPQQQSLTSTRNSEMRISLPGGRCGAIPGTDVCVHSSTYWSGHWWIWWMMRMLGVITESGDHLPPTFYSLHPIMASLWNETQKDVTSKTN